jgi:hypothetical protein
MSVIVVSVIIFFSLEEFEDTKGAIRVHLAMSRFELTTLVVIGTDCIVCCKSNYLRSSKCIVKGAIRNRISKKNRQHNGQKKKDKRTNNDRQNIHIKLKIE